MQPTRFPVRERGGGGRLVDRLALAWGTVQTRSGVTQTQFDGERAIVTISDISLLLAGIGQATPQNTQLALLRTLLINAEGEIDTTARLIWQQMTMRYTLDLRPVEVGNQRTELLPAWNGTAVGRPLGHHGRSHPGRTACYYPPPGG